jgi:hypothetical protein
MTSVNIPCPATSFWCKIPVVIDPGAWGSCSRTGAVDITPHIGSCATPRAETRSKNCSLFGLSISSGSRGADRGRVLPSPSEEPREGSSAGEDLANVGVVEEERRLPRCFWGATAPVSAPCRENLKTLASLLREGDESDCIMLAELLRELGEFDSARQTLSELTSGECTEIVRQLGTLCDRGDTCVRELHLGA